MCVGSGCCTPTCPIYNNVKFGKYATRNGWKERKRIVEFHVLLLSEPVPLTFDNVIGEMQKGLGGYLYHARIYGGGGGGGPAPPTPPPPLDPRMPF